MVCSPHRSRSVHLFRRVLQREPKSALPSFFASEFGGKATLRLPMDAISGGRLLPLARFVHTPVPVLDREAAWEVRVLGEGRVGSDGEVLFGESGWIWFYSICEEGGEAYRCHFRPV